MRFTISVKSYVDLNFKYVTAYVAFWITEWSHAWMEPKMDEKKTFAFKNWQILFVLQMLGLVQVVLECISDSEDQEKGSGRLISHSKSLSLSYLTAGAKGSQSRRSEGSSVATLGVRPDQRAAARGKELMIMMSSTMLSMTCDARAAQVQD